MDIKAVLESEDGKAAIAKAVEEATSALKSKNDELLGEKKKMKDDLKAIQDQLDEIKTAKEEAEAAAAEKSGDVEKIKATLEAKHKKEIEALSSKITDKDAKLHNLLIENGLTEALTKAGVAPQYLDAAKALIKSTNKAEIGETDGNVVATVNGVPLSDYVSQWSQGDGGKHFISAPANGGGGSGGSNGGNGVTGDQKRSTMNHVQKAAYIKEHGQEAYQKLPE